MVALPQATSTTQRTVVDGSVSGGSGGSNSPQSATSLPSASSTGDYISLEVIDDNADGTIDKWYYGHENQRGDRTGMTNAAGNRVSETDYSKHGDVYTKHIIYDGRPANIAGVLDFGDVTHIDFNPGFEAPASVYGAIVRAVADGYPVGTGPVLVREASGTFIEVFDPNDEVLNALTLGGMLTVFDQHIGSYSGGANTGGTWTAASYDSFSDTTTLTQAGETFADYSVGYAIQINANLPVYNTITSASGSSITVSGDATAQTTIVITGEECYFDEELGQEVCESFEYEAYSNFSIITPSGVNPETGATQTDPCVTESRYYWGGGYYLPPIVGFEMTHGGVFGIQGAQPGNNLAGQHHMHNRIYDINTGRFTTPDPAASPWSNLQDYVGGNPLSRTDPSGLDAVTKLPAKKGGQADGVWKQKTAIKAGKDCTKIGPVMLYHSGDKNLSSKMGKKLKGVKIRQGVHNISDLIEALREMVSKKNCGCKCIGSLNIYAHGGWSGEGGFRMGDDTDGDGSIGGKEAKDFVSGADDGKKLGQLIKGAMCKKCEINIYGCKSGDGDTIVELARATGCTVRGSKTNVQGSTDDGTWKNWGKVRAVKFVKGKKVETSPTQGKKWSEWFGPESGHTGDSIWK